MRALHQAAQERHPPLGERALEHGAREAVDLHQHEPPPVGLGRATQADAPHEAIHGTLEHEDEVIERHGPSRPV